MIKIRKYRKEDEKQVKELITDTLTDIWGDMPIKEWEKFSDYLIFYIAEDNEKVVGTIALKSNNEGAYELKRMYVHRDYRRKGIATKLFNKINKFVKNKKGSKIILTTYTPMKEAIAFYERNGFKIIKTEKEKNFMEKKL